MARSSAYGLLDAFLRERQLGLIRPKGLDAISFLLMATSLKVHSEKLPPLFSIFGTPQRLHAKRQHFLLDDDIVQSYIDNNIFILSNRGQQER